MDRLTNAEADLVLMQKLLAYYGEKADDGYGTADLRNEEAEIVGLSRETADESGNRLSHLTLARLKKMASEAKDRVKIEKAQETMITVRHLVARRKNETLEETEKKLMEIYGFSAFDLLHLQHFVANVNCRILGKKVDSPTMLCLYNKAQRTGKTEFASALMNAYFGLLGKEDGTTTTLDKITGRFAPLSLVTDPIMIIDEIGSSSRDRSAELKSLITGGPRIMIERKGRDQEEYDRLASFILTSNDDPTTLFYGGNKERRLSIINFSYKQKISTAELGDLLLDYITAVGAEPDLTADKVVDLNVNGGNEISGDEVLLGIEDISLAGIDLRWFTVTKLKKLMMERGYVFSKERIREWLNDNKRFVVKGEGNSANHRYNFTLNFKEHLESVRGGGE